MTRVQADIMLLAVTLTAAAGWVFSKTALTQLPPFFFIGIRFLIAGTVLSLFCHKALLSMTAVNIGKGIITGSLFALAMMVWIQGLHHSLHIGEASFIVSLGVMFVPFFAYLFLHEKLPKALFLSIPIAIVGLATLNLQDKIYQGLHWEPAQFILIIAAIFFALQFTLTSYLARSIAPLPLTAMQLLTAGVIALIAAFIYEDIPQQVSPSIIGHVLAAAIIASSFRFLMQAQALKHSPVSHAGMILLLEPVWVTILGMIFLNESLNSYQIIGCILIFTALVINRIIKT